MRNLYLVIALSILLSVNVAGASGAKINALFNSYNISSSLSSSLTYKNITYNNGSYFLAYNGARPYFLINGTGKSYAFVLNASSISQIITPTLINASIGAINVTYLAQSMKKYNETVATNMTYCLTETGLSSGLTCTVANSCQACEAVQFCGGFPKAYPVFFTGGIEYLTGGVTGIFGQAIIRFESQYNNLTSNMSIYSKALKNLSASNIQAKLPMLYDSFGSISNTTQTIAQSALFPPPQNLTVAQQMQCAAYVGTGTNANSTPSIPASAPWYCAASAFGGYCTALNYNMTLLSSMQSYINSIAALPLTQPQISIVSQNLSAQAHFFVDPTLTVQKHAVLEQILNTSLVGLNNTIIGATVLLTHISNASLSTQTKALSGNYAVFVNDYAGENLTSAASAIQAQYKALQSLYVPLNSMYYGLISVANNNTALLLNIQSVTQTPSAQVTSLSLQQAQINAEIGGKVSNVTGTMTQLESLSKQIQSAQPVFSIPETISREIDAPFASAILAASGQGHAAAINSAPLLATIPSIIICIILLAALLAFYHKLTGKRRIAVSRRTTRNWNILFVIAIIVALVYVFLTYTVAQASNASAPLSVAGADIKAAHTVAIALNGTISAQMNSCANLLVNTLKQQGKNATLVTINGNTCNTGTGVTSTDSCLAKFAGSGTPMIILTNATKNSLTAYSFYGTIMSSSGTPQFMGSCLPYVFIR